MVRRLLLIAALLFGIFTMHTLGHPAMPEGPGMSTATDASAAHVHPAPRLGAAHAHLAPRLGADHGRLAANVRPATAASTPQAHPAAPDSVHQGHPAPPDSARQAHPARKLATPATAPTPAAPAHTPATAPTPEPPPAPAAGGGPHRQPGHSMDPLSVCLAVLGDWGAALLAALGLVVGLSETGSAVLAALRARHAPVPPPRISLSLARLSVSRI